MRDEALGFRILCALTGNKLGKFDIPCPLCGPDRRSPINVRRKTMRVWHEQPDFITYNCERCKTYGYCHDRKSSIRLDPARLRHLIKETDDQQAAYMHERRRKARWLWDGGQPIEGTIAEYYLRNRGITRPLPGTLRFRPARGQHPPCMLAAFGVPLERIPGILDVTGMMLHGVHITRLKPDGSKAPDSEGRTKLTIGPTMGLPIVLAPVNDLGGLAVAEGVEDALSLYQATGMGAWAAGCANRLPPLACAVPQYVTSTMISVDDDEAGRRYAYDLARQLAKIRGKQFEIILFESAARAAA